MVLEKIVKRIQQEARDMGRDKTNLKDIAIPIAGGLAGGALSYLLGHNLHDYSQFYLHSGAICSGMGMFSASMIKGVYEDISSSFSNQTVLGALSGLFIGISPAYFNF